MVEHCTVRGLKYAPGNSGSLIEMSGVTLGGTSNFYIDDILNGVHIGIVHFALGHAPLANVKYLMTIMPFLSTLYKLWKTRVAYFKDPGFIIMSTPSDVQPGIISDAKDFLIMNASCLCFILWACTSCQK